MSTAANRSIVTRTTVRATVNRNAIEDQRYWSARASQISRVVPNRTSGLTVSQSHGT